ncbi:MAG: DUF167 domain-containing protein [Thermodesulfobacteriota bacterium]|nr:DUF167 domain-containing protein [Thermodesulfobacteriota bacterium]
MLFVNTKGDGLVLNVWVQPGSNRNKIQSITEDAIRIKVTSPPKEGLANKACTDFLAKELGVKRSQVEIIKGHKARKKKMRITGITQCKLEQILKGKISS